MTDIVTFKDRNGNTAVKIDETGNMIGASMAFDTVSSANTITASTADILGKTTTGSLACASVPTIETGTAAPTTAPAKVGDIFIDTVTPGVYIAKGTAGAGDWVAVS